MNRRSFLQLSGASAAILAFPTLTGCSKVNTAQLAALAQTLGTSVANIASLLNRPDIATKITTITDQVVLAIQNWKQGDTTQNIIQLLGDLQLAINLIPVSPQIQALITLALGTIQGILALFPPAATGVFIPMGVPQVKLAKVPHTKSDYASQWNSHIAPDGKFASARIQ